MSTKRDRLCVVDETSVASKMEWMFIPTANSVLHSTLFDFLRNMQCHRCCCSVTGNCDKRLKDLLNIIRSALLDSLQGTLRSAQHMMVVNMRREARQAEENVRRMEGSAALGEHDTVARAVQVADATVRAARQFADRVEQMDGVAAEIRATAIEHRLRGVRAANALTQLQKLQSGRGKRKRSASQ